GTEMRCAATAFSLVVGLIGIAGLPGHAHPRAQETDRRCFNGYGYTLEGGELRYVEHHEQLRVNGEPIRWHVTYYDPQGHVIATKTMDFSHSDTVPVYTFRIPRAHYVEGIDHENGQWRMYRRKRSNAQWQTQTF